FRCGDLTILLLGLAFYCFCYRKQKIAMPQPWQAIAQRFCSIRIYQFDFNSIAENSSYFFINFTGNTKMANIAAIVYIKNIIIVIFIFALSRYKITETIIPITANKAHKFPATLFA